MQVYKRMTIQFNDEELQKIRGFIEVIDELDKANVFDETPYRWFDIYSKIIDAVSDGETKVIL